jgi:hypothetical protein
MIPAYEEVQRRPNVMKNRNPLKSKTSKVIKLAQRVKELQNYKEWQKLMAEYRAQGIVLSPKLRPLIKMVKLGAICIDEDIQ